MAALKTIFSSFRSVLWPVRHQIPLQSHVTALQTMSSSKYSVAKGTSVITKCGYSLSTKAECAKCVTESARKHLQPINFVLFLWLQKMQSQQPQLWVLQTASITGSTWALTPGGLEKLTPREEDFDGFLGKYCLWSPENGKSKSCGALRGMAQNQITILWSQTWVPYQSRWLWLGLFRKELKGKINS